MQTPFLVLGTVYTNRGTILNSVVIVNNDVKTLTDSKGRFVLDLANLSSGYTIGESYVIESYDSFNNEFVSDTITVEGSGITKNLFLSSRETGVGSPTGYNPELRNVGDKPVTFDNPLVIKSLWGNVGVLTRKVSQAGYPKHIGYAPPGTPTSASKWAIQYVLSTGETTWANGNAEFDKVFDDYASYDYS